MAVSLGLLSAPGTPFRVFTDEPGMQAMTMLPWIFVPLLLVPIPSCSPVSGRLRDDRVT
ncbi:MAG: hypothetical protein AB7O44_26825 [Hyphomicrobiaceae bacterium]